MEGSGERREGKGVEERRGRGVGGRREAGKKVDEGDLRRKRDKGEGGGRLTYPLQK